MKILQQMEILALAAHVDSSPEAIREWFFETPIQPYGKTAFELVRMGRGADVMAFLKRVARDCPADDGSDGNAFRRSQRFAHRRKLAEAWHLLAYSLKTTSGLE